MQAKGKAPAKAEPTKNAAPAKADPKKEASAKATGTATPKDPKTNTNSKAGSSMPSAQNSKATLDVKKKDNDSKTLNSQASTTKLASNTINNTPQAIPQKQEDKPPVVENKKEEHPVSQKVTQESSKPHEADPIDNKDHKTLIEPKSESPQKKIERSFDITNFKIENAEFFPSYTPVVKKKLIEPPKDIVEEKQKTIQVENSIKQEEPIVAPIPSATLESPKTPTQTSENESKPVQIIKTIRKTINKTFLIRRTRPENTRNDQRALFNKLVSPKQKPGVSIFSNYHSVLESLMTADTNQTFQSPNERTSKVMFDKNFNADSIESSSIVVSSPHLRNPNSKIIADQINYLKTLKQSKLSIKSEPSLLVPSNTLTKSAILSSETNFENEYKSILDRQKLNSKNQKVLSSTVGKVSFAQKAMISSQKLEGRFKGNTLSLPPEDSLKKKGLSSKGADLYMKLNEKVRW